MATMGRYCKAYLVKDLEAFQGWNELAVRRETPPDPDGLEPYAFLHEDYTVTGGIFLDEDIVFNAVTPEWIAFCDGTLAFEPPPEDPSADEPIPVEEIAASTT